MEELVLPETNGMASLANGWTQSAARDLSEALWAERHHLAELLHALDAAAALTPAQRSADASVFAVIDRKMQALRVAGLGRDIAADALFRTWGAEAPTLPEVISIAPSGPWVFIFSAHLNSMEEQLSRIGRYCGAAGTGATNRFAQIPRALRHFICGPGHAGMN